MKRIVVTKDNGRFRVGQHEVIVPPGRYTKRALEAAIRMLVESAPQKLLVRMEEEP